MRGDGNRVLCGLEAHTALVGSVILARHDGRHLVRLRDQGTGVYDPVQKQLVVFAPQALIALASIDLMADEVSRSPAASALFVIDPPSRL